MAFFYYAHLMLISLLIGPLTALAFRYPISCFSCASEDYQPFYESSPTLQNIGQPVKFDKICDTQEDVQTFAPAVRCDSTCVSVLEPQFFGGILNERQPYKFVRGCATDVFALAMSRPAEIEFMHAQEICLSIPLSEIWPEVPSNDLVKVCSCTTSGCNMEEQPSEFNRFADFPLSNRTKEGLEKNEFITPTEVQRQSLPHSLEGKDVVAGAKTGSGKTLALVIPLLECLFKNKWTQIDGLGALVIVPTRELAYQIFEVINKVGFKHHFSVGLLIGGTDVKEELKRLYAINIIICTPGRLLQHLEENSNFHVDQMQMLIVDEADRILDMGFKAQMDAILEYLPKDRQTLLFSATQTRKVDDLVRLSVKDPVFINAHEHSSHVTPDKLIQSYIVCNEEDKINFLWSFLMNHKRKKTVIFVTCCRQARFLTDALFQLKPGFLLLGLWGTMNQNKRLETFQKFDRNVRGAALIATDVASRGLDFKNVDWVLQLDCPPSVEDYIHRVGRTARMDRSGEAVLVLTPKQEEPFIKMLTSRHVNIEKIEPDEQRILDIKKKLMSTITMHPNLKDFAQKSFVDYSRAVFFSKLKSVFDVSSIDFDALAASYGLPSTPRLRFLKRQGVELKRNGDSNNLSEKNADKSSSEQSGSESDEEEAESSKPTGVNPLNLDLSDEDESDEPVLKISKRDVLKDIPAAKTEELVTVKDGMTKNQLVRKKLKRKNITWNSRKTFDE